MRLTEVLVVVLMFLDALEIKVIADRLEALVRLIDDPDEIAAADTLIESLRLMVASMETDVPLDREALLRLMKSAGRSDRYAAVPFGASRLRRSHLDGEGA